MLRVRFVGTVATVALAVVVAGCSGSSLSMPDWLSPKPAVPPPQTLQFESDPPGADVRTAQGQTCQTPCSLNVPAENQAVAFTKVGYLPQTVQVTIRIPEHSMFESPPPDVQPNPVAVVLQPAGPPRRPPPKKPRLHRAAGPGGPPPPPPPPPPGGGASPFPPPPQQR